MRIGLFGGTFNPIHFGHLRVAEEVKEMFYLEKIYFIPSAIPPHKDTTEVANAKDRLFMVEAAISKNPDFELSHAEIDRKGTSYTIDTINHFKSIFPNSQLFFIIGLDAFLEVKTWKSCKNLFEKLPFIVLSRPKNYNKNCGDEKIIKNLEGYILKFISNEYSFNNKSMSFEHENKKTIFTCQVTPIIISSTKIRKMVREGKSIRYMVTDAIYEYIKSKKLYL